MNVRQLMEILAQLDPDLPVCVEDWNEGWAADGEVSGVDTLPTGATFAVTEGEAPRDPRGWGIGPYVLLLDPN